MGAACSSCKKMSYHTDSGGVYGFDMGGISDSAITLVSAFGGYVTAQKIDTTITALKDNPKTSGLVWTGASLAINMLFPQMAQNKMVQGASIGVGIYGLKRLNQGYDILKGITGVNGTPDFAANYRMQQAQMIAANQARQIAPPTAQRTATPSGQDANMQLINYRLAA